MLHVTAVLEDTVIVAAWDKNHEWLVTIGDNLTGKSFCKPATERIFSALMALALGVGEDNESPWFDVTRSLYEIVEPWLEGTPPECRPIP